MDALHSQVSGGRCCRLQALPLHHHSLSASTSCSASCTQAACTGCAHCADCLHVLPLCLLLLLLSAPSCSPDPAINQLMVDGVTAMNTPATYDKVTTRALTAELLCQSGKLGGSCSQITDNLICPLSLT